MRNLLIPICLVFLISSCASMTPKNEKTQLQIRQFQTRSYATTNEKMILRSVANVLQDDGYTIDNANMDLGLIKASKAENANDGWGEFFSVLGMLASVFSAFSGGSTAIAAPPIYTGGIPYEKLILIDCTANINTVGNRIKIRVNFIAKKFDNHGNPMDARSIEDEEFYIEFFVKLDKSIFIQEQNI